MAAPEQSPAKMASTDLRGKAIDFLNSKQHANNLADILNMFNNETDNFTPLLLAIELIFTKLLRRGDLFEDIVPLKPAEHNAESEYLKWLRDCYETALNCTLTCMKKGTIGSRVQALVTACKLMQEEGRHPMEECYGYFFPHIRLKNIFTVLLDGDVSMSVLICRFQEYTEYRDVQQHGLKVMSILAYRKRPNHVYIENYLELLEKLLTLEIPVESKDAPPSRWLEITADDKHLCGKDGKNQFEFNPAVCRRYVNRCWGFACQWPLMADDRTHRRAIVVLVEKLLPYLFRPQMATDMLCDSLDSSSSISMIALRGMLDLIQQHSIDYPDIYDRLYGMFEPEMFATRCKKRLMHLADIFLSSTRLSEALVAAFAKRLSRLALIASPEDAGDILELLSNIILRHPGLKRMLHYEGQPAIMPKDPYVMEETCASASRAIHSSLWEVSALRGHFQAEVSAAAARLIEVVDGRAPPTSLKPPDQVFDVELKKRFRTIEMNFVRQSDFFLPPPMERLARYFELTE